ncbi:YaiI/YqxD family protein [Salicibibacter halophilus]|uniref:UPF0178 protein EPH95_05740 n=1 Tax=Salicibibacter halophilus TaxID=2502791 RepID=A0A514LFW1_9BACI|nr:YaiI/YqxD family protein [Salicibibacter halophilus]QDI90740.1 YaiI/YqxD family protein [Salicibibacter halophilus]
MNIYVDADACPVKDIIIEEARAANIPVVLVKSFNHYSLDDQPNGVETIYVDTGADAADYRIMQLACPHDLIVTQDYGLAALGLAKHCIVLHHNGFVYSNENIESLLNSRHTQAKMRRSGQKTKGPKLFTDEDRERFKATLQRAIGS